MKAFLIYQLEVAVCLTVFYLFYQFVLRQENQFLLRRIYFLFSIVASLVLPAVTVDLSTTSGIPTILPIEYISLTTVAPKQILTPATPLINPKNLDLWVVLFYLWLGGLVFFTVRLIISIVKIIDILGKSKCDSADIRIRKTDLNVHSFSFFKFIVLNKKHDNSRVRSIVLAHELAHANQLHSVDILLCELLKCFQWFNPFVWLLGQKVIMNLEFLADQAVLKKFKDVDHYQHSLLQFAYSGSYKPLKIEFSKIHLKERFLMMNRNTKTIHPGKWLGLLVLTLMIGFTVSVKGGQKEITEKVNRSISSLMDPAPLQISGPSVELGQPKTKVQQAPTTQKEKIVEVKGKVVTAAGPAAGASIIAEELQVGTVTNKDGDFQIVVPTNTELKIILKGYVTNKVTVESTTETMSLGIVLLNDTSHQEATSKLAYIIDEEFYDEESGKNKLDEIGHENFNLEAVATDHVPLIQKYGEKASGMVLIGSIISKGEQVLPVLLNSINAAKINYNKTHLSFESPEMESEISSNYSFNSIGGFVKNEVNKFPNLNQIPDAESPLFVIDNLLYEGESAKRALEQIGRDNIEDISIIKGNSAEIVYGSKARNGVVKIRLKKGLHSSILYAGSVSILKKNKKNTGIKGISISYDKKTLTPIFIINQIEYSHEEGTKRLDEIRITEVEDILLYEGRVALQRYGDKGKNGVIVIVLKEDN